jgi:hypothetical protein
MKQSPIEMWLLSTKLWHYNLVLRGHLSTSEWYILGQDQITPIVELGENVGIIVEGGFFLFWKIWPEVWFQSL